MDRFVIRRSKKEGFVTKHLHKKEYKQMSLHSLKGVVVIEDVAKLNQLLRISNQEPAVLLSCLEQLSQKLPSREILRSTKIGHAVKRLTSHSNKSVSQLARCVISSWKNHFEEKLSKPSLDVRCDHATTESRTTVRKHITAALLADSEHESSSICSVSESLEFELFRQHRQLVTNSYRRVARRLVLSLRRNESLCRDVCENKDCIAQLITELRCGRELSDGLFHKSQAVTSEPTDCS